jgi:predicted CopG family antitoxin
LKVLGVDEEIRKKIQQNESTQTSFAELIVEMVKRKKEKQPRCLEERNLSPKKFF